MAVILLPSLLAREAGGEGRFETDASNVRDALQALPIADLLFDERGNLRPLVNVYVDREQIDDLATPLEESTEIRLVAAVAGG
jgi:molybdopterin converting factor small subunit